MLDKFLGVLMLLGLVVMSVSLLRGIVESRSFEIVEEKHIVSEKEIIVDIGGAVVTPGVYSLPGGSRVKDVLVMAGGFSAEADREMISKLFNLAEILKDGQKIYIPKVGNTTQESGYAEAKNGQKLINVNTALSSELDTLWGIGESRASDIVKNRPYKSLEEMVAKKVITKQLLEKNRQMMSVY